MDEQKKPGSLFSFSPDFWLVVIPIIILIVIIAWALTPNFYDPHAHHIRVANSCINNLRQIDAAVHEFALENHLTNGARIHFPDDLKPYIKLDSQGKIPSCPQGGIYHLNRVGDAPTCSLGNTVTPGHYLP